MPERADALAEYINNNVEWDCDVYLIDNASDISPPAKNTNIFIEDNVQTTGGWLWGLRETRDLDYFAYWFLITSAAPAGKDDILTPMAQWLVDHPGAVGIHPALTEDSTTAWEHLITRGGTRPRRTWMIDNISSLWRADWFNSVGRFDARMFFGWGIDLETSYKARVQDKTLWVDERVRIEKETNIGYKLERMNMDADDRSRRANTNMRRVFFDKYGPVWEREIFSRGVESEML